jgi:hypothetical protein
MFTLSSSHRAAINITAIIGTAVPHESLYPRFSGRFETQISGEMHDIPSMGRRSQ